MKFQKRSCGYYNNFVRFVIYSRTAEYLGQDVALLIIAIAHIEEKKGGFAEFDNIEMAAGLGIQSESQFNHTLTKALMSGWIVQIYSDSTENETQYIVEIPGWFRHSMGDK